MNVPIIFVTAPFSSFMYNDYN